jgi:hypothetical protein
MQNDPIKNIRFSPDISDYDDFFDFQWSTQLTQIVEGTVFVQPAFDLTTDWHAATSVASMPSTFMHSIDGIWKVVHEKNDAFKFAQKLANSMTNFLMNKLPDLASRRTEINAAMGELSKEYERMRPADPFPLQQQWEGLTDDMAFQLVLCGSQRLAFGAIYFAYENFVQHVIQKMIHNPTWRTNGNDTYSSRLTALFDAAVANDCLVGQFDVVKLSRLVRNSLAHNGGRVTGELKAIADAQGNKFAFHILDGYLQIMAGNTRDLYNILKYKVLLLAEKAVAKYVTAST